MYCKIKNEDFYYKVEGEGIPIIILHGCGEDHQLMTGCMEPIFDKLSGYQRIYFDLPGMGKSAAPAWMNNSDAMLDTVLQFINFIIPNQDFILIGQSYGGYLARGVLYKMKSRVKGLFLLCPVVKINRAERICPNKAVIISDEAFLSELSEEAREDFCEGFVVQNKETYNRYINEVNSGSRLANIEFIKNLQKQYAFTFDVDAMPESKFDKPVLMLMGKQDDCVGYMDHWNLLNNYERATFAVLDIAGHNLQIERPKVFDSLVIDWILRIE